MEQQGLKLPDHTKIGSQIDSYSKKLMENVKCFWQVLK